MGGIELSPRLRSVGELVPRGCRYADVGTDHAYLPVWLLQRKIIGSAIACDLRPAPLERAGKTVRRYGLENKISLRLCDGLSGIAPEEVECVSIAGMGGETIASILAAAPWSVQGQRRWLLQPMSAAEELRAYLNENGFSIRREVLSREEGTLYVTVLAVPGGEAPYTPAERWAGRQRRDMEQPLRGAYLEKLIGRARHALEGLRRSRREADRLRLAEFEEILEGLLVMKEEWTSWQA